MYTNQRVTHYRLLLYHFLDILHITIHTHTQRQYYTMNHALPPSPSLYIHIFVLHQSLISYLSLSLIYCCITYLFSISQDEDTY